jgi:hypothetical protein
MRSKKGSAITMDNFARNALIAVFAIIVIIGVVFLLKRILRI